MTLIISIGNSKNFIQASDRRLSANGKVVDNNANKSAVYESKNGRFAVGFTGLALYRTFETQSWFTKALCDCAAPDFEAKNTLQRFTSYATDYFKNSSDLKGVGKEYKRLSIMFTGYSYYHNPPRAALALISNFENLDTGEISDVAKDKFDVFFHQDNNPEIPKRKLFHRIGFNCGNLFYRDFNASIDLAVDEKPPHIIESRLVQFIRKISNHPESKNTVGSEVFCVVIPRDRSKNFSCSYYPNSTKKMSFRPNLIVGIDKELHFAVKDIKISLSGDLDGQPIAGPKLHPNQPCWCRSKRKYKNCHGSKNYHNSEPTIDFKEFLQLLRNQKK